VKTLLSWSFEIVDCLIWQDSTIEHHLSRIFDVNHWNYFQYHRSLRCWSMLEQSFAWHHIQSAYVCVLPWDRLFSVSSVSVFHWSNSRHNYVGLLRMSSVLFLERIFPLDNEHTTIIVGKIDRSIDRKKNDSSMNKTQNNSESETIRECFSLYT
jgi:hypothetical protein